MLTEADVLRIRDDVRIERLRELAARMRRQSNNGQAQAAKKRDAERRQAALQQARRLMAE